MDYPHRRFRIAAMHEALSVTAGNLRHDPLPDAGANLAVSRIEIAVVGNVHDLVCPVVHKQEPCRAVPLTEPVNVTHRPAADRALAGHADITANGSKTLTFCHPVANNISKSTGVVRLCHILWYSHAILREYSAYLVIFARLTEFSLESTGCM